MSSGKLVKNSVLVHTEVNIHFLSKNSQEFDTGKMLILWKLRIQKCEFWENWEFKNVNFEKIENSKMWIQRKLKIQKCEFCENWVFQNVIHG